MHSLQCTMYIRITKTILLVNHLESNAGDRKPKVYATIGYMLTCVYTYVYGIIYAYLCL